MTLKIRWLVYGVLFLISNASVAQKLVDLQRQKAQTLERISTTSLLIEEGSKSQAQNTRKLDLLTAQIETRNDLIKNINQQIELYNREISHRVRNITQHERERDTLLSQYAQFVKRTQFLQGRNEVLLQILASDVSTHSVLPRIFAISTLTTRHNRGIKPKATRRTRLASGGTKALGRAKKRRVCLS